ncbi:MAG: cyclic nucleotide-binding domain-containing protein [Planctomycetota bacterium]
MIDLHRLRNYSLFGGLNEDTLSFLLSLLQREEFVAGHDIVRQGAKGDSVYFIVSGKVAVRVDGRTVHRLGEGEQFGEMHLIDIQARSATVTAETDVTALSFTNRDLLLLRRHDLEAFTMLLMNCARDISRRLREMNHQYAKLARATRHMPAVE